MARHLKFSTAPYTLSDIPLGSLVPNVRYPNQDALSVLTAKLDTDYTARDQQHFKGLLDRTSDFTLRAQITRLLSIPRSKSDSGSIEVQAERGILYELTQPKIFFRLACAEPKVRTWLQEGLQEKLESYFVVGLRTFHDATVGHKAKLESQTKVDGSAPIGEVVEANTGVGVGDAADISMGKDKDKAQKSEETFATPGEYIYAICYRRIILRTKSVSTASLDKTNEWKLYSETREDDPSSSLQEACEADLEDEDFIGENADMIFEDGGEKHYGFVI